MHRRVALLFACLLPLAAVATYFAVRYSTITVPELASPDMPKPYTGNGSFTPVSLDSPDPGVLPALELEQPVEQSFVTER